VLARVLVAQNSARTVLPKAGPTALRFAAQFFRVALDSTKAKWPPETCLVRLSWALSACILQVGTAR
jgi:hypothetical protein